MMIYYTNSCHIYKKINFVLIAFYCVYTTGAVALHHAAFSGEIQCVASLTAVTPVTITDDEGRTPVHAASLRGHKHVMEHLRASGWPIDVTDSSGNTALHMSAWFGSLDAVEYLMEVNLNPYQKNDIGLTPLDYAVREGHHDIEVSFLKREGGSSAKLKHTQQLIVSASNINLLLHMLLLFVPILQFCWDHL